SRGGAHSVIAERALDEDRIVRVAQRQLHLHAVRVPYAGQHGTLVLPGPGHVATELTPGVGLDEPLQRVGITRVVDVDSKPITLLVNLLEQLHWLLVERR